MQSEQRPPFKIQHKFFANPLSFVVEVDWESDTIQKVISAIEDQMGIPAHI